jgi:hypothetical protein
MWKEQQHERSSNARKATTEKYIIKILGFSNGLGSLIGLFWIVNMYILTRG